ncbi:TRAP transporter substrate-binding protein [Pusillimonas sp. ANT_WB101]|uniref:TRAP transporter substrate-binding protein n=1 Tax=Pusillimonas sp. ANT_WB101 TaxID=2597356 RepID=UPI0011ED23BD|nr:TRAP transporter substrate-binding protein DctP [Pusillimonas sp. ANT_WB101]KAA0892819.1 ABC transporter substrate-binding protein [Pusillimonas sp. ANT_WB101]
MKFHKLLLATAVFAFGFANAANSAEKKHELTFSTYLPPAYEYAWKPIETFVKNVEERSNGRVKINVFHSAQLFDGYEELPAVSRGDVDIVNMTSTYPSGTVPALSVFTLPFLFDSTAHLKRALDAGLFDLGARQELEQQHDAVILGIAPWDPYEFYSRNSPIKTVDDIKGKVWASTGSIDAQAIQALGGSPTSMPSSELYLSFDRGVIDATPRPLLTGMGRSLYEVAKHISLVNFGLDVSILAINKKKWDSLPADIQEIISTAAKERDADQLARVETFITDSIDKYKSLGVTVERVDSDNLSKMRAATQPVIAKWSADVKNGDAYLKLVNDTRKP